ncbi:unnamed protein product [marine sediment metagenome]|uniref:Uncharacterized protein n=1 Tax=marine sediment metagenome TaxID=412755 RepID=X0T2M5_9ZZZZ
MKNVIQIKNDIEIIDNTHKDFLTRREIVKLGKRRAFLYQAFLYRETEPKKQNLHNQIKQVKEQLKEIYEKYPALEKMTQYSKGTKAIYRKLGIDNKKNQLNLLNYLLDD